jgi:hypothetical protein
MSKTKRGMRMEKGGRNWKGGELEDERRRREFLKTRKAAAVGRVE